MFENAKKQSFTLGRKELVDFLVGHAANHPRFPEDNPERISVEFHIDRGAPGSKDPREPSSPRLTHITIQRS